jgi:hypothetical protein
MQVLLVFLPFSLAIKQPPFPGIPMEIIELTVLKSDLLRISGLKSAQFFSQAHVSFLMPVCKFHLNRHFHLCNRADVL